MAEPFGIAASAFQVAGAGIELANTLKAYIDSVRKAEKQLKPIADHVKLTSDVLTNVGTLLKNEDIRNLYTKELLGSTENALGGCRKAFEDLEKFISKMLKPNDSGKVTIQARYTFYFKQKELDVLQAHLERFKSSLDLVLGVLNLAHSAKTAKDTSAIAEMKLDIQRLIQAEHEAKKKEIALATPPPESDISRELTDGPQSETVMNTTRDVPSFPAMTAMVDTGSTARALDSTSKQISSTTNSTSAGATPEDTVLEYLHQCAEAAQKLTADIEKAISKWHGNQEYEQKCLLPAFQTTMRAMDALSKHEDKSAKASNPAPPYAGKDSVQSSDRIKERFSVIHREEYIERDRSQHSPKDYPTVKRYQRPGVFPRSSEEDDSARNQYTFERERPPKTRDDSYLHWQLERERRRDRADAGCTRDYDVERYQRTTDYYADHAPQSIIVREQSTYSQPIIIREYRRDDDYFYERKLRGRPISTRDRTRGAQLEGLDDSSDGLRESGRRDSDISVQQRGFGTRIQDCSQAGTVKAGATRWRRSDSRSRSRSRSLDQIRRYQYGSMSRSRSRSLPGKHVEGIASGAAVGALAGYALKRKESDVPIAVDGRSRSRRRRASTGSYQGPSGGSASRETEYFNKRLSQADFTSAAAAGVRERVRSMGRERSRSRGRTKIPIASVGLGGAALAELYETNEVKKEVKQYKAIESDGGLGQRDSQRHTFSERVASSRNSRRHSTARDSHQSGQQTPPSKRSPSPPSVRPARSPVAFVTNTSGRHERVPDEEDEAAFPSPVDRATFQAAIGFAGQSFNADHSPIDDDEDIEYTPPQVLRATRESLPGLRAKRNSTEDDMVSVPLQDGPAVFDLSVASDVPSVDELLERWTTLSF